jgi:hypothetical protein
MSSPLTWSSPKQQSLTQRPLPSLIGITDIAITDIFITDVVSSPLNETDITDAVITGIPDRDH